MLTLAGGGAGSGVVWYLDGIGEVDTGNFAFSKASLRAFGFEGSLLGPDYSCIEANGHGVPPVRLRCGVSGFYNDSRGGRRLRHSSIGTRIAAKFPLWQRPPKCCRRLRI